MFLHLLSWAHALVTATTVGEADNFQLLQQFSKNLVSMLEKYSATTHNTEHLDSAKIWSENHKLQTSSPFTKDGKIFSTVLGEFSVWAVYCQYITHEIFKEVINLTIQ